jgi:hypothetical protein
MIVNIRAIKGKVSVVGASLILSLAWAPAIVSANASGADSSASSSTTTDTTSTKTSTNNQSTELANIISKGNLEIQRRLGNLQKLSSLISSSAELTSNDQTLLSTEVTNAQSGLESLQTQLDGETTVSAARTDAQSIVTEYRIYALVDPKVHLIKIADDQQVTETKLSALSEKLQTRLTTASTSGQSVTALQADLETLNSSVNSAQTVSSQVETAVLSLEPTDYNSDHTILTGYNTQLATAKNDIQAADTQAKAIVSGLEALSSNSSSSSSSTN